MKCSVVVAVAVGALASFSAAQCDYFINMNWAAGFVQGSNYTIAWTPAEANCMNDPVTGVIHSGTYSRTIFCKYWMVPEQCSPTSSSRNVSQQYRPNVPLDRPSPQPGQ